MEDYNYFGNPDKESKPVTITETNRMFYGGISDKQLKEELEEMILNCGWLREKKLLRILNKIKK